MIEESYVSLETARMLKEVGFDVPCTSQYTENEFAWENLRKTDFNKSNYVFSRPTQALVARWLREVHNIYVCIDMNAAGWYYNLCKSCDGTYILWSSYHGPNDGGNWDSYEESLEAGLQEAIKLIKE